MSTPRRSLRGVVVAAVIVGGLGFAGGLPASAQEPALSVVPDTGLIDNQTVTVSGTGFVPDGPSVNTGVLVCRTGTPLTLTDILVSCAVSPSTLVSTDGAGTLTGTLVVSRTLPLFSGTGVLTCGVVSGDCTVVAISLVFASGVGSIGAVATAAISFAPLTPPSSNACKRGRWSTYVDDDGRPFRNQGQCVAFAVAARRGR